MVIWIIGLSSTGKTTLAKSVFQKAKEKGFSNLVHLDGDQMRELYGGDLGHDVASRRMNSTRIQRLCKLLDDQDIHVICSILSIFPDARDWCRCNLRDFAEIYIESPMSELLKRDKRNVYASKNAVGSSIEFPTPVNPDIKIDNSGDLEQLLNHTDLIVQLFKK